MKMIPIVSALVLTLASSASFAQTAAPPLPSPPARSFDVAMMVAELAPGGILLADKPTVAVEYVAIQPSDLVASSLMGATIYNKQEENIGKVADLVFSDGDHLTGVVASVGGFLGVGDSYVALDPASLVVSMKDGKWAAHVDATKDELSNAPKFTYPSKSG